MQRIPADPHDKVGLAAAIGQKPLQDRRAVLHAQAQCAVARHFGEPRHIAVGRAELQPAASSAASAPSRSPRPARWLAVPYSGASSARIGAGRCAVTAPGEPHTIEQLDRVLYAAGFEVMPDD